MLTLTCCTIHLDVCSSVLVLYRDLISGPAVYTNVCRGTIIDKIAYIADKKLFQINNLKTKCEADAEYRYGFDVMTELNSKVVIRANIGLCI